MATTPPPLDYQELASMLDSAVSEQQRLAKATGDPVARYQSGINAQVFSVARRCAQDHARSHQPAPQRP